MVIPSIGKVAVQIVNASYSYFPWAEDAITHLRRDGKVQCVEIKAEGEAATRSNLALHVGFILKELCRYLI